MPIAAGQTLLHYRLVDKIGEGGMGQVWKAVDTALDREVAIKILPEELAGDAERLARFEREAKILASLNHGNIAVVHGLHEARGVRFLAMELVPGEDLSRRLEAGALGHEEALQTALRIALALEAAHERGVVHRDLKPANIRISRRGEVKVLDFGLAKEVPGAPADLDTETVTRTYEATALGLVVGTAGYMSPEQARGLPVDTRTDIWAFGCVLYEMLTGVRPFGGATLSDKIAAVLTADPDWEALPPSTPGRVRALLRSCLARDVEARLADIGGARRDLEAALADLASGARSAAQVTVPAAPLARRTRAARTLAALGILVLLALGGWWLARRADGGPETASPAAPDRRSVAVLPFENMGADPDGEVFTAGIHDDILTQLAKIGELKTISRTSVLEYQDTTKSIVEIGRELGVAAILEGGVRRAGDQVRINVKLIDAGTEENLWAESYDRQLTAGNIFALQSEIATEIAFVLQAKLSPAERQRLASAPTDNLDAYDAYLRGTESWKRPGSLQADLYAAERDLLRAIELDPGFALAYARLSQVYRDLYWLGGEPTESRLRQAFAAAEKAVELGPDRGESHHALGLCWYVARDYEQALEHYARAEETLPGDADLAEAQAAVVRRVGRFEESLPGFERALALDPRDAQLWYDTGLSHAYLGRYAEAERYYAKALEIAPDFTEARVLMAINRCNRDATVESCRAELAGLDPTAVWEYRQTGFAWRLALQARAFEQALALLAPADDLISYQEWDYPVALLRAITHELTGDAAAAAEDYRTAASVLEPLVAERTDYAPHRGALGLVYAGLDRKADALREGRRALALLPVQRDALVGSWQLGDLGFIYMRTGEHDLAVETFERYLSRPATFSAAALVLDPRLEPLREHPRFRELLGTP